MKLAIGQMVLGVVIVVSSRFIMAWGHPTSFPVPVSDNSGLSAFVEIYPGPPYTYAVFLTYLTLVLGLAVLGCGTAQFLRARRQKR